jgi:hypothetical protein
LVPAINIVRPANVSDVTLMPYFLEQVIQRVPFPIHAIVADKGYIDASIKEYARKELAIPIVTGVRDGMSPPEGHGEFGPECFYGVPLVWDQYDPQTHENLYLAKGDSPECRFCIHQGHCYQEIRINAGLHEHYFGMIPLKSKTARCLLQIVRPQVERGNELDKNRFGLKHYFLNSLEFVQILSHLADACQLLMILKSFKTRTKYIAKEALGKLKTQLEFKF